MKKKETVLVINENRSRVKVCDLLLVNHILSTRKYATYDS